MSSGFPGDYYNINNTGRSIPSIPLINNTTQTPYRSPLTGILADSSSHMALRRPDFIGKRSLAEFQQQHIQQQAAYFLRNVKHRPYNQYNPLVDLTTSPEISSVSINTTSSGSGSVPRYGVPVMQQFRSNSFNNLGNGNFNGVMGSNNFHNNNMLRVPLNTLTARQSQETEGKMRKRLQELEKELLLDDEDGENDVVSGVTNSEWSETIQNILGAGPVVKPDNLVSLSPTSSSSSSCASSSASPASTICLTQLFSDAAAAIADGKPESATEVVNRIGQVANAAGTPEQRLSFCMTSAFRARLGLTRSAVSELYGKEHILATQLLYDKSVCFKLGFMAANAAILDAGKRIHVVDFDVGKGVQYVYLLHALATARDEDAPTEVSLKITTFVDFGVDSGGVEGVNLVGDGLKSLANKLDVRFSFCVSSLSLSELDSASLKVEPEDVLVVNFAFKLYKLPDESVTTENLRDEVLRRVKGLSPALVTVVEQELNANTASFETRVSQVAGYYGALLESLDATMGRGESDRVKIEEGLSRKMVNSVACEGRDRVERCEVFGKWRVRMSMAGFEPKVLSQLNADSLLEKVYSVSRGNPGFTAKEDAGGISFGWKGRTLTVASAWH